MNYEIALINAVLEADKEDITGVVEQNIQNVFTSHPDIWEYTRDFYFKYGTMPSKDVVKKKFTEFEFLSADLPVQYYLDEAKRQSMSSQLRRNLKETLDILNESGPSVALNYMTSTGLSILRETGILRDTNLAHDYLERVNDFKKLSESEDHVVGVPTGISVIDKHYGGLQGGDFIVLLGWTGAGKSWIARLFAANAWKQGYSPLIISLEMNKQQEGYRLDTILNQGETFTNSDLMFGRNVDPKVYEGWAKEQFAGKQPIHLVTSEGMESANQNMVEAKIEQYKPDMVVLDYHALFEDANGSQGETDRVKNLSKAFKKLAVKYNVPIVDIAAVTMPDGHGDRPPDLNEVAWSKQLAYDADLVLAIHRRADESIFEVVSRKVRRGSDFAFYLQWDLNTGKHREIFDV